MERILIIVGVCLSLVGCFGGMNPNETKGLTGDTEIEDGIVSPMTVDGTVQVPATLAMGSLSSLQALAIPSIDQESLTAVTDAPDGTLVEFMDAQMQVVTTGTVSGGKFSVDLDAEDFIDPQDPDFITMLIRTTSEIGGEKHVQLQVVSQPVTEEGLAVVGQSLETASLDGEIEADVTPGSTGIILSLLKDASTNPISLDVGKKAGSQSQALAVGDFLTGRELYHALKMFKLGQDFNEKFTKDLIDLIVQTAKMMNDPNKNGPFLPLPGGTDRGDSSNGSPNLQGPPSNYYQTQSATSPLPAESSFYGDTYPSILQSFLSSLMMSGAIVNLEQGSSFETTVKFDMVLLKMCGLLAGYFYRPEGISLGDIERFIYTGSGPQSGAIMENCSDKAVNLAQAFLPTFGRNPGEISSEQIKAMVAVFKDFAKQRLKKAQKTVKNYIELVKDLLVWTEARSLNPRRLSIFLIANLLPPDILVHTPEEALILYKAIGQLFQEGVEGNLSDEALATVVKEVSYPALLNKPPNFLLKVNDSIFSDSAFMNIDDDELLNSNPLGGGNGGNTGGTSGGANDGPGNMWTDQYDDGQYSGVEKVGEKKDVEEEISTPHKDIAKVMESAIKVFVDFWKDNATQFMFYKAAMDQAGSVFGLTSIINFVVDMYADLYGLKVAQLMAKHPISYWAAHLGEFEKLLMNFLIKLRDKGMSFDNRNSPYCHGNQTSDCSLITQPSDCATYRVFDGTWNEYHDCYWNTALDGCYVHGSHGEHVCVVSDGGGGGGDQDGDGFAYPTDCDDKNPGIHPGASEICDFQDNDCDGSSDEGLQCGGGGYCGDGQCNGPETSLNCLMDCGGGGGCQGFQCSGGYCLDPMYRCDGAVDCPGSPDDEMGCSDHCFNGLQDAGETGIDCGGICPSCGGGGGCAGFQCGSGTCLDWVDRCDGQNDCNGQADDEMGCGSESSCSDGFDNDSDNLIDCNDSGDCFGDPACGGGPPVSGNVCPNGGMPDYNLGGGTGTSIATGDNYTGSADSEGSCASSPTYETSYEWTAPATGTYTITTEGSAFNTVLYVADACDGGMEIACNDDKALDGGGSNIWSEVSLNATVGVTYIIVVDGRNFSQGTFQLNIISSGGSCSYGGTYTQSNGSPCGCAADCASNLCPAGTCVDGSCGYGGSGTQTGGQSCGCNADCSSGTCSGNVCTYGGGACNYDGICDAGETYVSCMNDCHCGNGICDVSVYGETSVSCPSDCGCYSGTGSYGAGSSCGCNADCASNVCSGGYCSGGCTYGGTYTQGSGQMCGCNADCVSNVCNAGYCSGGGGCYSGTGSYGAGSSCGCNADCASNVCSGGYCSGGSCSGPACSGSTCTGYSCPVTAYCIYNTSICNGVKDCTYASEDEMGCATETMCSDTLDNDGDGLIDSADTVDCGGGCGGGQWLCPTSGGCIPTSYKCDGINDCFPNYEDENPTTAGTCGNAVCNTCENSSNCPSDCGGGGGNSWNFDTGFPAGWTVTPLLDDVLGWNTDDSPNWMAGGSTYNSSPKSLNYNNGTDYYYSGGSNSGAATSPSVAISGMSTPTLKFWSNYETEGTGTSWDQRWVRLLDSGDYTIASFQLSGDSMGSWTQKTYDLTSYKGYGSIKIRFEFMTIDGSGNNYDGWFVDDVEVGEPAAPSCGDYVCSGGETCSTCSMDCGACAPYCGDSSCNGGETCSTCSTDCGACAPYCGDGFCNGAETSGTCPSDCGGGGYCGDYICNNGETSVSCPSDCTGGCMYSPGSRFGGESCGCNADCANPYLCSGGFCY